MPTKTTSADVSPPQNRRSPLLIGALIVGVLAIPIALYVNHLSANWVPDAEAKVRAAKQQQAEQAFAEVENQARQHPQDAAAQMALAKAWTDRGEFVAALLPAEHAAQLDPRSADAHLLLAMIDATTGYQEEALAHYKQAILLKPDELEAYQHLGDLLQAAGDMPGAVQVYQQAQIHVPQSPGPRISLAQCYLQQKKNRDALEILEPILKTPDPPVAALYMGGKACQALGQTDRGIELLKQAIGKQDNFADAHHTLGSILSNAGRYAEGIPELQKAVALTPDSATYHYALGNALLNDAARPDHLQLARQSFETALEFNPQDAWAHYFYGLTLEQMGETEAAIREYRRTITIAQFGSAYLRLGMLYKSQGRMAEAKKYLDIHAKESMKAINQVHGERRDNSILDTAEEHYRRGMQSLKEGQPKKARADFQIALERDPNFAPARRQLDLLQEKKP